MENTREKKKKGEKKFTVEDREILKAEKQITRLRYGNPRQYRPERLRRGGGRKDIGEYRSENILSEMIVGR